MGFKGQDKVPPFQFYRSRTLHWLDPVPLGTRGNAVTGCHLSRSGNCCYLISEYLLFFSHFFALIVKVISKFWTGWGEWWCCFNCLYFLLKERDISIVFPCPGVLKGNLHNWGIIWIYIRQTRQRVQIPGQARPDQTNQL